MTNEQMKICKTIIKYKNLKDILTKAHIEDYYALQEKFKPGLLDFSDYDFEDNTIVSLTDDLLEEYEQQNTETFYHRISIIALIVSIFAALASISSDSVLWSIIWKLIQ